MAGAQIMNNLMVKTVEEKVKDNEEKQIKMMMKRQQEKGSTSFKDEIEPFN
uniref:Uncharacterized protein n=1 Tax=Tetranychus urticae TaxID=32264 RepID=T1K001_TETUR